MESKTISAEGSGAFTKNIDSRDKKIETNEIASDRESSIESFHTNKSEFSNTTGTELIDVDDIELSDEESWLYQSPKKVSTEEKSLNTYKWLHKDVEDMDDEELQVTKKALVNKLKQLQFHSSFVEVKNSSDALSNRICDKMPTNASAQSLHPSSDKAIVPTQSLDIAGSDCLCAVNKKMDTDKEEIRESSAIMQAKISNVNELFDVADVQKIARLQEESLKQSIPRYHMYTERRSSSASRSLSPAVYTQNTRLSKPSSVEALNTCCGKLDQSNIYSLPAAQRMKKINSFGSSSALQCQNLELLRGSLPNINKGYYSLRSKKSNRSSDQRKPCPLPIYPSYLKSQVNGSMTEISTNCKPAPASYDQQGSRTLPSSYRIHSRNNSSKRDLTSLTPSPRRESSPFFPNHQNGSMFNLGRRESAPGSSRRFLSPASSPTAYQRSIGSTTSLQSPTKSSNNSSRNVRSSTLEHPRSHSSSRRRQPLTTVHNRSPQRGNSTASYQNEEFRITKMPSKIPSPDSKSGISVPSSASKARNEDNWSHDCF